VPVAIEEFVGDWVALPTGERWALSRSRETGTLGRTAVVGGRVWMRNHKFRIVLGPLSRRDFDSILPNSETMLALAALVRLYTNDEWAWDLRLVLGAGAAEGMPLGRGARLGWTTRFGRSQQVRDDLLVDPELKRTRRVRRRQGSLTSTDGRD
jgi:type VI secretion system protein ImpH